KMNARQKEARIIRVDPDSEIALLVKDAVAAGVDVVVDTGEARYPLSPVVEHPIKRVRARPLRAAAPSRRRATLESTAGSLEPPTRTEDLDEMSRQAKEEHAQRTVVR